MIIRRIRPIRFAMMAAFVALLQQTFAHRFSGGYIGPDLIVLLAAFMACGASPEGALSSGLILGLLRDAGSTVRPGAGALSLVAAVLLVLVMRQHYEGSGTWVSDVVFTFLVVTCSGVLFAVGSMVFSSGGVPLSFVYHSLGSGALTAAIAPPFFTFFRFSGVIEERKTTF